MIKRVSIKKGTFYLSSNTQEEADWTRQEFSNPQTGAPMVKFHKELSIKGKIMYAGIKDDKYKGKVFSILVQHDADVTYGLEVPIMSTKGVKTTDDYFNSLVGPLANVQKGDSITLFVNNKNLDKNDRLYRNIVVLDSEDKLIKSNFSFNDVPSWDVTEGTDDFGEVTKVYNASKANKYYIDIANSVVAAFEAAKKSTPPADAPTSQPAQTQLEESNTAMEAAATMTAGEIDDLPF